MKKSYLFAIVLGIAMSSMLSLFKIEMSTVLWWVVMIIGNTALVIAYFKLKD